MTLPTFTPTSDALRAGSQKIKKFRKELQIGGPPELTRALVAQVRSCCHAMKTLLQKEGEALNARYGASYVTHMGRPAGPGQRPKDDADSGYLTYKLGAYGALLFEMIVAASVAAQIFALGTIAAGALGVVITLGIAQKQLHI